MHFMKRRRVCMYHFLFNLFLIARESERARNCNLGLFVYSSLCLKNCSAYQIVFFWLLLLLIFHFFFSFLCRIIRSHFHRPRKNLCDRGFQFPFIFLIWIVCRLCGFASQMRISRSTALYALLLGVYLTLKKQWIILLPGMNHIIHLKDNKDKRERECVCERREKSWSCTVLIEYGKNYEKRFWIFIYLLCQSRKKV